MGHYKSGIEQWPAWPLYEANGCIVARMAGDKVVDHGPHGLLNEDQQIDRWPGVAHDKTADRARGKG